MWSGGGSSLLLCCSQDSMRSLLKANLDPSLTQDRHTYPRSLAPGLALFLFMLLTTACHCEMYFSVDFPAPTKLLSSLNSGSLLCFPSQLQPSNQCLGSWPWFNPAKALLYATETLSLDLACQFFLVICK